MRRSLLLLALAVAAIELVPAGSATADVFGKIAMASDVSSKDRKLSNSRRSTAHDPDLSGNGRYIAFDGYFAGAPACGGAIFRQVRSTGRCR